MNTERLIMLRKERSGWRQSAVAKALKISTSAYSSYEQGTREPDNRMLIEIADFYGVSTDYLLGRVDARIPQVNSDIDQQVAAIISQLANQQSHVKYRNYSLTNKSRKILIAALQGIYLIGDQVIDNISKKNRS